MLIVIIILRNVIFMTMKMAFDNLRNDIKEFCYNVYGDSNYMENEILRSELKNLGIINGDDEMVWKSPDNSLIFEVLREYSTLNCPSERGYRYICTIKCENNLRVPLFEIIFTELDAIDILFNISEFVDRAHIYRQLLESPYSYDQIDREESAYINLSLFGTNMEQYSLYIEDTDICNIPYCILKFNKYNPMHEMMTNMVTLQLTYDQLCDFSFHLFFAILIDIDIPEEYDEKMLVIEDFVTTGKQWNHNIQRQQMVQQYPQEPVYQVPEFHQYEEELKPREITNIPKKGKLKVIINRRGV